MAIKLSTEIPELFNPQDPMQLQAFTTAVRQVVQEIADKAQSAKKTLWTAAPAVADFEVDNELIAYDDTVNRRVYYLVNGAVRYATLT